jgi:hypothetical protein
MPIPNAKVAWASSRTEVATITEAGLVSPDGYGTTVVSASASSVGKATIVVMRAARAVIVTPAIGHDLRRGPIVPKDSIKLTAKALDEKGQVITGVAFHLGVSAAGTATATVNGAGAVLARSLGRGNGDGAVRRSGGPGTVRVASAVKSIQLAAHGLDGPGEGHRADHATALGYDDKPMGGARSWTSSNPTVANGRR